MELSASRADEFGLELERVDLKDMMFPGDLKRLFAQSVAARKQGLATLERARGETAALRGLANAARMIDGNPALLQLRLLQEIGQSEGNTIVLGLPPFAPLLGIDAPTGDAPTGDDPSARVVPEG